MSMDRRKIEESIKEARRFIVTAQAAIERLNYENAERDARADDRARRGFDGPRIAPGSSSPGDYSYGSPETGALRRHSMDLTRKLAELRK
jgi:hypothetical protein